MELYDRNYYLNGEKFNLYSGAIHYFRSLPEYWHDRLLKMKLAGLTTVETYTCWNLHEPQKGVFNFEGMLDVIKFVQTAAEIGLKVIIRPGPFICGEWEFGGLPAWLLKSNDIRFRCANPEYMGHVKDYFEVLLPKFIPYLETNGGNIIAMQIENEYGSFGNDYEYLKFIEKTIRDCGIDVLLFSSDGNQEVMLNGGSIPETFKTINFGYARKIGNAFEILDNYQTEKPLTRMEFWCGMFSHWGENNHVYNAQYTADELQEMLDMGAYFNFYMFHGGTSFGFMNGANTCGNERKYSPDITSYDYDSLLTEWGGYTKKYYMVREILLKHQNIEPTQLPPEPKLQNIGEVHLTQCGTLFDNLDIISNHYKSATTECMEHFDQDYGFILYHYNLRTKQKISRLNISGLCDRAIIFINGEVKGILMRDKDEPFIELDGCLDNGGIIDILVENMGRVNFALPMYKGDRKGILDYVCIDNQILFGWDVYTIPLNDISKVIYNGHSSCPAFFKGEFNTSSKDDCFVHLPNFTKGVVYINSFNLGRYWNIGPQMSLYLPGVLLKEKNEIVVFELEKCNNPEISIKDYHDLGECVEVSD